MLTARCAGANATIAPSTVDSTARIPALDGLRGIAILMVVLFHIDQGLVSRPQGAVAKLYHGLASVGWSGVDLFFVLSGFLITGILYDSANKLGYFQVFYVPSSQCGTTMTMEPLSISCSGTRR